MFSNPPQQLDSAYPIIKETVPRSALGYNTNNKYPEFPPLMSDGRSITATWQPEAVINADLLAKHGIQNNWQYRNYLTQNAKDIMRYNFRESSNDAGYYKRAADIPSIQSNRVDHMDHVPHTYKTVPQKTKPFGYVSSDLKDLYLSREELDACRMVPVVSTRP
jgi:hypothetical protein